MAKAAQHTTAEITVNGDHLKVDRVFTAAGQNPFDTVEWETRDAVIGFGGKVSFEQRNVEFPASIRPSVSDQFAR